jgi:hypothetical protein
MSDQPPLVPPTPPRPAQPGFEPDSAPAYGDVGSEAPIGMQPLPPVAPVPGTPYQSSPYQIPPQYLANPAAPTHPLAITSLVLGIVGILGVIGTFVVGVTLIAGICSPFAIWLGLRSKREIRQNPQSYSGEGVAIGGFVTGIVGLVLGVLVLLAIVAFVAFIAVIFASAGA